MKLMIASDIHGSAYYCKKMIDAYKNESADKLVILGDILYHGPRNDLPRDYNPGIVAKMLNEIKTKLLCVRGNCDSEVDQMVLEFPIMADYAFIYLDNRVIFASHGHKAVECEGGFDVILGGHTHVPACERRGGYVYLNPGSVSIPKENSCRGYMTLENGIAEWKDFLGNILKRVDLAEM